MPDHHDGLKANGQSQVPAHGLPDPLADRGEPPCALGPVADKPQVAAVLRVAVVLQHAGQAQERQAGVGVGTWHEVL